VLTVHLFLGDWGISAKVVMLYSQGTRKSVETYRSSYDKCHVALMSQGKFRCKPPRRSAATHLYRLVEHFVYVVTHLRLMKMQRLLTRLRWVMWWKNKAIVSPEQMHCERFRSYSGCLWVSRICYYRTIKAELITIHVLL
jgi:hypothetical protein